MLKLASTLSLVVLAACARTGPQREAERAVSAQSAAAAAAERAREALEQRLRRAMQPDFVAVPGERELSGRMIARPLQRDALQVLGLNDAEIDARRARARAEMGAFRVVETIRQTDEYLFEVPAASTENEVARRLMATWSFQYVEPDWTVFPIACPNDTFFSQQWHHQSNIMQSCAAWDLHTGNPSVSVGICDTGIRTTHEDLQLHRLEGYNAVDRLFESQGGNIGAVHPHGTQTTGCAAANGNNGIGVAGVGWNLSHRMLRVSNSSSGSASLSNLQHAARTAVENGDRVASVSYSGVDTSSNLTTATYIKSIGGLLVWAAGNDNRNITFGNRDDDDILVAGATTSSDVRSSFSAFGPFVDLMAPGSSVATTGGGSDTQYVFASGTSFACPLTAGLCALVWSANPSLTPDQVENILKQSADDLGAAGVDNTYGYGRINSLNAVTQAGGGGSPPVAEFSGTPTSGTAPLTVDFTDLSTNSPTGWSWTFGDGGTSSAQNPSYTYNAAGTYTVSLTASNSFGSDTETKVGYITVSPGGAPPVAEFSGTPTSGTVPLTVSFTDLSTNGPTGWSWAFGDGGTSSAQNPSYTYNAAGTYTVSLTASNSFGSDTETKVGYITVSPAGNPPVAEFSGTPTSGTVPLTVSFTDLSTNAPTGWSWMFGDGGTSSAQNPSHTYTAAGTYTVSLTASNSFGSDTETKVGYITVSPAGNPPVAEFAGTPTSGTVPLTVSFTDLSTNSPTGWSWTFGDGGTSSAQNPSHTYTTAGTYTVSLTASNSFGSDGETKVGYITVDPGGGTEQQLAFDGWESNDYSGGTGWAGAWTRSGDVRIRTDGPHSGSRHVRLRRSTGFLQRQVNTTATAATLIFWARVRSFENGDSARVRVNVDDGGFTTVRTFVNGEDDNVYHRYEFALGDVSSSVVIEFDANMSGKRDYVYFDDIEIRGVQ